MRLKGGLTQPDPERSYTSKRQDGRFLEAQRSYLLSIDDSKPLRSLSPDVVPHLTNGPLRAPPGRMEAPDSWPVATACVSRSAGLQSERSFLATFPVDINHRRDHRSLTYHLIFTRDPLSVDLDP
ncbi:conserved hypothetical protein, partial [Ricinus communis]